MNRTMFAIIAAGAIAAGLFCLRPNDTIAAEGGQGAVVNAVMQVDIEPIITRMAAMQDEIAALKESMDAMSKALETSKVSQLLMLDAIRKLAPERWEYKVVRTLNEKAVEAPGLEGWEMVTISQQGWVYFKRPLELPIER